MLLELFELASNNALQHDPVAQTRLSKLEGKTMVLHIKRLEQSISVTPYPEGLEFSSTIPESVDVTLSTTIGAMIKITRDGMEDADLDAGELEMSGDPIIGQRFAQLMSDLEIDWEAMLAEQIGDSPARLVSMAASNAKDFVKAGQTHFKDFVSTVLKEDLQIIASKEDVDPFLDNVDTLRADAERLSSRIKRIQNAV